MDYIGGRIHAFNYYGGNFAQKGHSCLSGCPGMF